MQLAPPRLCFAAALRCTVPQTSFHVWSPLQAEGERAALLQQLHGMQGGAAALAATQPADRAAPTVPAAANAPAGPAVAAAVTTAAAAPAAAAGGTGSDDARANDMCAAHAKPAGWVAQPPLDLNLLDIVSAPMTPSPQPFSGGKAGDGNTGGGGVSAADRSVMAQPPLVAQQPPPRPAAAGGMAMPWCGAAAAGTATAAAAAASQPAASVSVTPSAQHMRLECSAGELAAVLQAVGFMGCAARITPGVQQ